MIFCYLVKNIWKRIFPIVLSDATIYYEIERIDFLTQIQRHFKK